MVGVDEDTPEQLAAYKMHCPYRMDCCVDCYNETMKGYGPYDPNDGCCLHGEEKA